MDVGDLELLARWQQGDRAAGTTLFRRHFPAVRRFFRNKVGLHDVEDLVQRTFAGLVEAAPGFRAESSVRVFVFAIARRQLYKFLRDRGRRDAKLAPDVGVSSIHDLGMSPSAVLDGAKEQELVQRALQHVCVEHQVMLELYYWEGIPGPEIAQVLGISPTTVRTRLHRARKALSEQLRRSSEPGAAEVDLERTIRAVGDRL